MICWASLGKIQKAMSESPDSFTMPKSFSAIIIGAGESGIAVGCMLKTKLGTDDFRIFDRQSGVGGAWFANRYPGVACDM